MQQSFQELSSYLLDRSFFLVQAIELVEKSLIELALARTNGNQFAASKMLGIHRNTMKRKMTEYEIPSKRPQRKPIAKAKAPTKTSKTRRSA